MHSSKKFDAHKKHFEEKEMKMRAEINYYSSRNVELLNLNDKLNKENVELIKEVSQLKAERDNLRSNLKLDEADFQAVLNSARNFEKVSSLLDTTGLICNHLGVNPYSK
jgi:uncharacterized coiled-coil DUF342 family protein